jgi:hypothetical protein
MQTFEYVFKFKRCRNNALTEHVVSPEPPTNEELVRIEFQLHTKSAAAKDNPRAPCPCA